uniref:Uncharacterized protein n=1 Tax=Anopheles albimanus TaxID=7167 RepID=A0A182FYY5_ANOAL
TLRPFGNGFSTAEHGNRGQSERCAQLVRCAPPAAPTAEASAAFSAREFASSRVDPLLATPQKRLQRLD